MTLLRILLLFSSAAWLLAQAPPPQPAPAPKPTVTMSMENPAPKTMPVVPPDRVVVAVGDLTITAAQFDQIIDALPEQYRSRGSRFGPQAVCR